MDDNKAVIYGSERKWLEALMPNYQVWGILEIFLGKDGLRKFNFYVLVIQKIMWEWVLSKEKQEYKEENIMMSKKHCTYSRRSMERNLRESVVW